MSTISALRAVRDTDGEIARRPAVDSVADRGRLIIAAHGSAKAG
ncbi:MAG: hypothetical protein ACRDRL_15660 [Sciscionella sp.]